MRHIEMKIKMSQFIEPANFFKSALTEIMGKLR